jgi:chaperone BCS1
MLSLPRRSMLLLEDLDAVVPERKAKARAARGNGNGSVAKGEEQGGITLAGLLNCVDGITAPDGAVIVMTTNHPELLDPALLRPGRVDMRVNFGPATAEQIARMWARLSPGVRPNGEIQRMLDDGYTTAQVQAALMEIKFPQGRMDS